MVASPQALADAVRAKRNAVDNDLELLRVKLRRADPRRLDVVRVARTAAPIAAGVGAIWWWARRRRPVRSLGRLFEHELRELYASEQRLLPALEEMARRASDPELSQAFEQHFYETEGQVERLDRIFRSVGAKPGHGRADAVNAVVRDAQRLLKRRGDPHVRDAWLIASAQRIEHIEIANYGTARSFAETLGYTYASQLLQQSLEEERSADEKLTRLAERFVNRKST
jgi:ferritin-like metal-binding protein YciE